MIVDELRGRDVRRRLRRAVVGVDHGGVVYRHAHGELHVGYRAEDGVDRTGIRGDVLAVSRWRKDGGVDVEVGCEREFLLEGLETETDKNGLQSDLWVGNLAA